MKIKHFLTGLTAIIVCTASASAADLSVIANSGLPINASEIKDIFLGSKQFSGSTKIVPVDNSAAQDEFLSKVLKMDTGKYSTLWAKKSFRDGLNPPAVKSSDAEVVEFVRRTPGAVGYVKNSHGGVNIIKKY
ncbi:phosphate ABC transporter substrate-binding protein [Geobacter sp.]|uniref:phosphate ABC transporter substrate-binding protein n=1 Tax=Geobacter sp. TaxID=46610 RepID=UPI002623A2A1|nr:phosphate ABC transporter substrate-binding protein [Geobacter sp.]